MNFATSPRSCRADRPLASRQPDHSHRRLRRSCCAAAVAVVALSVPAAELRTSQAATGRASPSTADLTDVGQEVALRLDRHGSSGAERTATPVRSLASASKVVHTRRVCVRVANVRSGPGLSYRVVTTLKRGATVRGTTSRGWLRMRAGRWISVSVTCPKARGSATVAGGTGTFRAWVRVIDPAGNARWTMDYARSHARGDIRGLTVFHSSGPARSTVYIQPGMTWSKTKLVMAHEAIHVRQIRYGGFDHSLKVFGSVRGMEQAADCGASLILGQTVRGGCRAGTAQRVRHLLAGRPA